MSVALLTEPTIRRFLVHAVSHVFNTMYGQPSKILTESTPISVTSIMSSIGFVGTVNGLVYMTLPKDFALSVTEKILGMPAGPDMLPDTIGELSNMIAGSFKNQLVDAGYPCKLTLPAIIAGTNLSVVVSKKVQHYQYLLQCGADAMHFDIYLSDEAI